MGLGSADWGEVRLSRQYNVAARYFSAMFGSSFGGGFNQLSTGAGLGFGSAHYVRYDNQIVYETPSMGGFKAAMGYVFNADNRHAAETGLATPDNTRHCMMKNVSFRTSQPLRIYLGGTKITGTPSMSATSSKCTGSFLDVINMAFPFGISPLTFSSALKSARYFTH